MGKIDMSVNCKGLLPFLCLISMIYIRFPSFLVNDAKTQVSSPDSLKYEVNKAFFGRLSQTIRIENPTTTRITGATIFVPIVRNVTAHHYVVSVNITGDAKLQTVLQDDSGNSYAVWNDFAIGGRQMITLRIDYDVLSFETRHIIDANQMSEYDTQSDLYRRYTESEEFIESDAPEIVRKAQSLTENAFDVHTKIARLYNFVSSHLLYVPQTKEKGALWALESSVGDCSEFSYLFVALCRAIGVPARVETGFAFHLTHEDLEDGHMWAEYYLEDYGWVPVDATWKQFDTLDEKHFSSLQSMSGLIPYSNYFFNYTSGPDESKISMSQLISFEPSSAETDRLVDETIKAVQQVAQARSAISFGKMLGTLFFFPAETRQAERALLDSEIQLQIGLQNWNENPQDAQLHMVNAAQHNEGAIKIGWRLIGYASAIFITTSTIAALTVLLFYKRYLENRQK
jgi:hypothetical protein